MGATIEKNHYHVSIKGKQRSLASILWVKYYNMGNIPDGYVIDHINYDGFDNRLENLQCLTVGENIKRNKENGKAHNQYTKD